MSGIILTPKKVEKNY